jgi:hypothetical protein
MLWEIYIMEKAKWLYAGDEIAPSAEEAIRQYREGGWRTGEDIRATRPGAEGGQYE